MTRPLPLTIQEELNKADTALAWKDEAFRERTKLQMDALRDAYPMGNVRLAQFLVEIAKGIQDILNGPKDGIELRLKNYQIGLVLLASAVSRKERGKPLL